MPDSLSQMMEWLRLLCRLMGMLMLRKWAFVALAAFPVGAGLHLSAIPARACTCMFDDSIEEEVERVDAVFRGEVVSIDSQDIVVVANSQSGRTEDKVEDMVEFRVSEVWKGERHETIYVKTRWSKDWEMWDNSCGSDGPAFRRGEEYLVFVYDDYTEISICTNTTLIDDYYGYGSEELTELGDGERPIPGSVGPVPIRDSILLPQVSVPTPTVEPTSTPESTFTPIPTPTVEPTSTPEPTPTAQTTLTPVPTPTPEPTSIPEPAPTAQRDVRSGVGCGQASGAVDLSAFFLVAGFAWFKLRRPRP